MKKHLHFCGIFAIAIVSLTAVTITSCDKDDEFLTDESEYTLAERMMTRSGEGGNDGLDYLPNECGVWCVLKLLGKTNSHDMYSKVTKYAEDSLSWGRTSGEPLYGEQMESLGKKFGIEFSGWKSNRNANGTVTNNANSKLYEILDDESNYDNKGKLNNVIISTTSATGQPHYVVVKGYGNNKEKLSVYDYNSKNPSKLSTISFNDIDGIIY